MFFSLFKKSEKKKESERIRVLEQVTNTIIGLQKQIQNLEKQRECEIDQIKTLIKNKKHEVGKIRYKNVKNIDELINRIYERTLMLERNKLSLIEEEGNRLVYNIMKNVNDDYVQNKVKIENVEKELDRSFDAVEDRNEVSGVYTSFIAEDNDAEYDDLVNSIVIEERESMGDEKEMVKQEQNDMVL